MIDKCLNKQTANIHLRKYGTNVEKIVYWNFLFLHTIGSIYKSIKKISSNDLLMTIFSNQSNGYFYVQILTLF